MRGLYRTARPPPTLGAGGSRLPAGGPDGSRAADNHYVALSAGAGACVCIGRWRVCWTCTIGEASARPSWVRSDQSSRQRRHTGHNTPAQVAVGEPGGQQAVHHQGRQQGLGGGSIEAQAWYSWIADHHGLADLAVGVGSGAGSQLIRCISKRRRLAGKPTCRDSTVLAQVDYPGCKVIAGRWVDATTGTNYEKPTDVSIDHLVPLKEASLGNLGSVQVSQTRLTDLWPPRSTRAPPRVHDPSPSLRRPPS